MMQDCFGLAFMLVFVLVRCENGCHQTTPREMIPEIEEKRRPLGEAALMVADSRKRRKTMFDVMKCDYAFEKIVQFCFMLCYGLMIAGHDVF